MRAQIKAFAADGATRAHLNNQHKLNKNNAVWGKGNDDVEVEVDGDMASAQEERSVDG